MAAVQNQLESLLKPLVGQSPVEKALHLVHRRKFAKAFDLSRTCIYLEVRRGHLKPTRLRGTIYFSVADILAWFETYQKQNNSRKKGMRRAIVAAREAERAAELAEVRQEVA